MAWWTIAQAASPGNTIQQWLNPASPPPLREPALWQVWFLETPWIPSMIFALAGLVAFFVLRSRDKPKPAVVCLAAGLGLASAIFFFGMTVRTPREQLRRATIGLVACVATGDTNALSTTLADPCTLLYFTPGGIDRATILARVGTLFTPGSGEYAVGSWSVEEVQAETSGAGIGATQARVLVTPASGVYNTPLRSWWRIDWRRDPGTGRWKATGIVPVSLPTL